MNITLSFALARITRIFHNMNCIIVYRKKMLAEAWGITQGLNMQGMCEGLYTHDRDSLAGQKMYRYLLHDGRMLEEKNSTLNCKVS